jgi:hypothetical protein
MKKFNITAIIFTALAVLLSCKEEEFEQATITFYPTLAGQLDEPESGIGSSATINLLTSRVLPETSQVNIKIVGNGAGYGYSYVTNPPQLEPGIVTLTIPKGENSASFSFTPLNDGIVEKDDYTYTFSIEEYNHSVKSTGRGHFTMTVKERPLRYYDFNDCSGTPGGFTEQIVTGAMAANTWGCTNFGYPTESTKAAEANAFGKGAGTSNSYLVLSSPVDATALSKLHVKMLVYSHFSGSGQVKIKYSTNYSGTGNPEAVGVLWTEVAGTSAQLPSAGSRAWTPISGTIDGINGSNVYIAIQYTGGTASSASNWRIENFEIKGE